MAKRGEEGRTQHRKHQHQQSHVNPATLREIPRPHPQPPSGAPKTLTLDLYKSSNENAAKAENERAMNETLKDEYLLKTMILVMLTFLTTIGWIRCMLFGIRDLIVPDHRHRR